MIEFMAAMQNGVPLYAGIASGPFIAKPRQIKTCAGFFIVYSSCHANDPTSPDS